MKPSDDNNIGTPAREESPQLVITNTDSTADESLSQVVDAEKDSYEVVTADTTGDGDTSERSLKEVIREVAVEEDHPNASQFTLRKILGGDILNARQVKAQVKLILLITFFLLIYISNRYSCQNAQIQIAKLEQQLQDIQKKSLSMSSELTELSRETNVLQQLKANNDTTLKSLEKPPYYISVKE